MAQQAKVRRDVNKNLRHSYYRALASFKCGWLAGVGDGAFHDIFIFVMVTLTFFLCTMQSRVDTR